MSSFHHNSPAAERLALAWHGFGAAASILQFNGALVSLAITYAFRLGIERLGHYVYLLLLGGSYAVAVNAFFGILWHLWAAAEHRRQLRPRAVPPPPTPITAGDLAARHRKRYPEA